MADDEIKFQCVEAPSDWVRFETTDDGDLRIVCREGTWGPSVVLLSKASADKLIAFLQDWADKRRPVVADPAPRTIRGWVYRDKGDTGLPYYGRRGWARTRVAAGPWATRAEMKFPHGQGITTNLVLVRVMGRGTP